MRLRDHSDWTTRSRVRVGGKLVHSHSEEGARITYRLDRIQGDAHFHVSAVGRSTRRRSGEERAALMNHPSRGDAHPPGPPKRQEAAHGIRSRAWA